MATDPVQSSTLQLLASLNGVGAASSRPSVADIAILAVAQYNKRKDLEQAPTDQALALGELYDKLSTLRSAASGLNTTGLILNKFASTGTGTLEVPPDTTAIKDAIDSFTEAFNDVQSFVQANQAYLRPGVSEALTGFARRQNFQLSDIGIELSSSGHLEIDSTALSEALTDNFEKVKAAIGGFDGVATRTDLFASQLQATPSDHVLEPIDTRAVGLNPLDLLEGTFLQGGLIDLLT